MIDAATGWVEVVSRLGFPIALVSVLIFFAWRVARFSAPRLSNLAEKHSDLIDTLKETQIKQLSLEERQTAMLNDHGVKLDSHGETLRTHREILDEIKSRVAANQCRGVVNGTVNSVQKLS